MSISARGPTYPTVYEYNDDGTVAKAITPSNMKQRIWERNLLDTTIAQTHGEMVTTDTIRELQWIFNPKDPMTKVQDVAQDEMLRNFAVLYLQMQFHYEHPAESDLFMPNPVVNLEVAERFEDVRNHRNPNRDLPYNISAVPSSQTANINHSNGKSKRQNRSPSLDSLSDASSPSLSEDDPAERYHLSGTTLHGTPQFKGSKIQVMVESWTSTSLIMKFTGVPKAYISKPKIKRSQPLPPLHPPLPPHPAPQSPPQQKIPKPTAQREPVSPPANYNPAEHSDKRWPLKSPDEDEIAHHNANYEYAMEEESDEEDSVPGSFEDASSEEGEDEELDKEEEDADDTPGEEREQELNEELVGLDNPSGFKG